MNKDLLAVAGGRKPADLVVQNGKIVNVYSGEIYDGGVAVSDADPAEDRRGLRRSSGKRDGRAGSEEVGFTQHH